MIYLKIDFVLDRLQFEELMGKTIHISKQPRTIHQPSNQGRATHLRAVGLQQSKQLIWERLYRNQLTRQLTKQLVNTSRIISTSLEVGVD